METTYYVRIIDIRFLARDRALRYATEDTT
jgi:hypothetical protein